MKKLLMLIMLCGFCLQLTACGVKGPLYYPAPEKTEQSQ